MGMSMRFYTELGAIIRDEPMVVDTAMIAMLLIQQSRQHMGGSVMPTATYLE